MTSKKGMLIYSFLRIFKIFQIWPQAWPLQGIREKELGVDKVQPPLVLNLLHEYLAPCLLEPQQPHLPMKFDSFP